MSIQNTTVNRRDEREAECCRIESLISIDERGQMILPKEVRDKADIRPGEKFAVVSWLKDGRVCCISLIRAEEISHLVKDYLGPVLGVTTS
jgi:AbrB family looped-hinge helix DNA binding protein